MSRKPLVVAALVVLIGVAAWWTLRGDDSPAPETQSRSNAMATEQALAPELRRSRTRAATPDAGTVETGGSAASKVANEAAARKYVDRTFVVQTTEHAPIAGATVRVGRDSEPSRTDAAGRVHVVVVEEASVFVRAEGFASRVVHLSRNWVTPDVIEMRRPQPVAGIVVDSAGSSVAGAKVWPSSEMLTPFVTGADGRFRFDDVDPDNWTLDINVACDGYSMSSGQVHPGDLDHRVALARPGSIEGQVVLPDGSPALGARIQGVDSVTEDGKFRITGLTAGEVAIDVYAEGGDAGFVGKVAAHLSDGETLRDVRVELRPLTRSFVVVRIVGPSGAPVTLLDPERFSGRGAVTIGGELTVIPMAGVRAGSVEEVEFGAARDGDNGYPDVRAWLVTRATAVGAPDIVTLPRLMAFEVDVVDADGNPAPLAEPSLVATDPSARMIPTAAGYDSVGHFQFRLAVGTAWRLVVKSDGVAIAARDVTPEELAAGRAVVRLAPGATVRVRITARPPAHIFEPWFSLNSLDSRIPFMIPKGAVLNGSYAIERVPPGKWEAWIMCCGSIVQKRIAVDVPESGDVDLGEIVLLGTTPLRGRVVTPDGRPAGGAEIEYFDADRVMDIDGVHALTRTDGTFEFDVPIGATGDLRVSKTGYGAVILPLDGKASWTEVRLGVAGDLRVRVTGTPGRPPSESIVLLRPGGVGLWCAACESREDEAAGVTTYFIRGLAPGKWIVRRHEVEPVDEREADVVAGQTADVTFDASR